MPRDVGPSQTLEFKVAEGTVASTRAAPLSCVPRSDCYTELRCLDGRMDVDNIDDVQPRPSTRAGDPRAEKK